jgi:CRP/FNR family transcriptional regulator, anaerobic regulatory protein
MYAHTAQNAVPAFNFDALAICRGLERSAVTRIAAVSLQQKLAERQTVFCEGDPAESVYEIVSGMLKLYKLLPDGRRQVTGFLLRGHLLGLASNERYLYTAEAVTPVTLCRYPKARFERLLDEVPGFARRLLAVTSDELRAAQDQMVLLGRKSAAEKLASFLLMTAEDQDDGEEESDTVNIPMGRADIADYLGLSTETVSRTLTQLKCRGVIALPTSAHIEIRQRDRLEQLAEGNLPEDF